jgi:hypothetical protein
MVDFLAFHLKYIDEYFDCFGKYLFMFNEFEVLKRKKDTVENLIFKA